MSSQDPFGNGFVYKSTIIATIIDRICYGFPHHHNRLSRQNHDAQLNKDVNKGVRMKNNPYFSTGGVSKFWIFGLYADALIDQCKNPHLCDEK